MARIESNGSQCYTLADEDGRLVIRRADGSWVYTLVAGSERLATQLLSNLNAIASPARSGVDLVSAPRS
jgi:hypothetical protein